MKKIIILSTLAFWGISVQAQNNKAQAEAEKIREAYLNSDEYKNASIPTPVTIEKASYITETPKVIEKNIDGVNTPSAQKVVTPKKAKEEIELSNTTSSGFIERK